MKENLCPNCSEYIFKLGIKKSELPYIKKRVNELFSKEDGKYMLERFLEMVDVPDVPFDFMETDNVEPYNKIKDELLAKRGVSCPFCKENIEKSPNHIKEFHKEEIKVVLRDMDKEEFEIIKKEIVYDNL